MKCPAKNVFWLHAELVYVHRLPINHNIYYKHEKIVLVQRASTMKREPCPSWKVTGWHRNRNRDDRKGTEGRGDRRTTPWTCTAAGRTRAWIERLSKSSFPSPWTRNTTAADAIFMYLYYSISVRGLNVLFFIRARVSPVWNTLLLLQYSRSTPNDWWT